MNYPWRTGEEPVDIDYITEELKRKDVVKLHYRPGVSEIIPAEQASLYLQEKGFKVREKEKSGEIMLVVSNLEKKTGQN